MYIIYVCIYGVNLLSAKNSSFTIKSGKESIALFIHVYSSLTTYTERSSYMKFIF